MSLRTICAWLTILCFFVSPALFAQSEVATIGGTVADTTGGVLAGAAVTARNEATNLTVSTVTNEVGQPSTACTCESSFTPTSTWGNWWPTRA